MYEIYNSKFHFRKVSLWLWLQYFSILTFKSSPPKTSRTDDSFSPFRMHLDDKKNVKKQDGKISISTEKNVRSDIFCKLYKWKIFCFYNNSCGMIEYASASTFQYGFFIFIIYYCFPIKSAYNSFILLQFFFSSTYASDTFLYMLINHNKSIRLIHCIEWNTPPL